METVYLDNSATTELCAEAKKKMSEAMEIYGNPSSLHAAGDEARKLLSSARAAVAKTLGIRAVKEDQLIFTSCGSEANNLALLGVAQARSSHSSRTVITTDSEHPSVENCMKYLEEQGFSVVRISTHGGVLDLEQLQKVLKTEKPFLVSMMMVNNETGAVYDVRTAFAYAKAANPACITHCDAVQGYLKRVFTPMSIGADMVTVSAHKIHGPKGVGALYINPDIIRAKKIKPFLLGGGQESGLRSGTENLIGICGFWAAAEASYSALAENIKRVEELRRYAAEKLAKIDVKVNRPVGEAVANIISITLPSIKSQTMLSELSSRGICVSNGSACSSHSKKVSSVLLSFGLSEDEADCTIRVSLSEFNRKEDIDALLTGLIEGIARLVRIRR